jgi:diguanylate cyclase (GGDEF)-like protein
VSRAQTLVLALLVLHVLLGGLSLVIARGEHRSAALRWWGWGLLVYSAGLFTTVASNLGWIPRPLAGFVGNSLVTVAPVLCAMGIVAHTLYRPTAWLVIAGVGASLGVLAYGNFFDWNNLLINMIAPTPIAVLMFLIAAWAIVRQGPRDALVACRFLAGMSVLAVATWITRIFVMMALLDGTAERERIDIVVSLFAIMQMVNGVGSTLALFWIDVRLMQAELSRVAFSDALTSLPNRRAIRSRFAEELSRAARGGQKFAVAVFDIDHFKRVNDTYGHALGDEVLKAVAKALTAAKRSEDVLGRIGGEEFLVILGQQSIDGAREAADRLRHAVAAAEVTVGADRVPISVSGGVALYPEDGQDWDHLFATADRRLYAAKAGGRNRIQHQG